MNFSLRTLLIITAVIGLSLVSFRSGGSILWLSLFGLLSIYCVFMIHAFIAFGNRKIFSIGFVIVSTLYAISVYIGGPPELSSQTGRLPTSYFVLGKMFPMFQRDIWIDAVSGEFLGYFDPSAINGPSVNALRSSMPDEHAFFVFGHVLLAAMFGILGGAYAVYLRKPVNEQKHDEPSDAPKSPVGREFES